MVGILPHRLHSLRPGLLLETRSQGLMMLLLLLLLLLLLRTIGPWVLPPLISCSLAQNPSESVCQYCAILTFARRSKGLDYSMSVLSTLILQFDSINFEYSRVFRRYIQAEKYLFQKDILVFVHITVIYSLHVQLKEGTPIVNHFAQGCLKPNFKQ